MKPQACNNNQAENGMHRNHLAPPLQESHLDIGDVGDDDKEVGEDIEEKRKKTTFLSSIEQSVEHVANCFENKT